MVLWRAYQLSVLYFIYYKICDITAKARGSPSGEHSAEPAAGVISARSQKAGGQSEGEGASEGKQNEKWSQIGLLKS